MRHHVQPDLKEATTLTIQIGLFLSGGWTAQHTRLPEKAKGRPTWTALERMVTSTTDLFRRNRPDRYQRSRPGTQYQHGQHCEHNYDEILGHFMPPESI